MKSNAFEKDIYDELIEFITENQDKFYRLAYTYTREKESALDTVQNAILKALEAHGKIKKREYMKTWFYKILVNESLMYLRKSKRETITSDVEDYYEASYGNNDSRDIEMYEIVDKLDEPGRTVILLHYYQELTLEEISTVSGTKLSTVKYRLYSTLKKLRNQLEKGDAL